MSELHELTLEALHELRNQVGAPGKARIDAELADRRRRTAAAESSRPKRITAVDRLEAEEQELIRKDLVGIGCKVYWLSQARETQQTKGVPDLMVFGPAADEFAFIEVKRQVGGKIRREQSEFAARARAAGIDHILGDRRDVAAHYGYTYEEDAA